MKNLKFKIIIFALILLSTKIVYAQNQIKYVFFFIGDGMGINQTYTAEEYLKLHDDSLLFISFSFKGLLNTSCKQKERITDSGAAGTALACGHKTYFSFIGKDSVDNFISIADTLQKLNKKIGLISSVAINDATPAAFYGQQNSRKHYDQLMSDLLKAEFDYLASGGILTKHKSFLYYTDTLLKQKYTIIKNRNFDVAKLKGQKLFICDTKVRKDNISYDETFPYSIDKPQYLNLLAEYTKKAYTHLDNPNGFFIMVEGAKIDWACHSNDIKTTIIEIKAFDLAIQEAYKFYLKHPDETMILITADHETGGYSLGLGDNKSYKEENYALYIQELDKQTKSYVFNDTLTNNVQEINQNMKSGWTTNMHTSNPVGLWILGNINLNPKFMFDNTEIFQIILENIKH